MYADPNSFESISKYLIACIMNGNIDHTVPMFSSGNNGKIHYREKDIPVFRDFDTTDQIGKPFSIEELRDKCAGMETASLAGLVFCIAIGPEGADADEDSLGRAWDVATGYVQQWNDYAKTLGMAVDRKGSPLTFEKVCDTVDGEKVFVQATTEMLHRL